MSTSTTPAGNTESTKPKKSKPQLSERARGERKLGWMLAGPAFFVMLAVMLYPIIQALWTSMFRFRLTDPDNREFVFLNNYAVIFSDPVAWQSIIFTITLTIVTVAVELVLGFAFAMVMHRILFARGPIRTVILIPYSIITVVSAFTWRYLAQVDVGFLNSWLHTLSFGAWNQTYDWFGDHWSAFTIIAISEIWKTTPFMSLLLLAGLAQIDGSLEEAAKVDGASFWQRLTKVILPNMKAAVMVALLFRTLDAFRIFDNPFVMTGGAQDTSTLSMVTYFQTISRTEIGMGSALSVVLFLFVLLIAALFIKGFKVDLTRGKD